MILMFECPKCESFGTYPYFQKEGFKEVECTHCDNIFNVED